MARVCCSVSSSCRSGRTSSSARSPGGSCSRPKGFLSNWLQTVGLRDTPIRLLDTRERGAARCRLQLPAADDLPALRRARPPRSGAARGEQGPRRQPRQTFFQVTLPLAMPGIVAGLLLVFIPLAGRLHHGAVLGGAKGNMVGALMVASQFLAAAEQGARLGHGGGADPHDPVVHRGRCGARCSASIRARGALARLSRRRATADEAAATGSVT